MPLSYRLVAGGSDGRNEKPTSSFKQEVSIIRFKGQIPGQAGDLSKRSYESQGGMGRPPASLELGQKFW